MSSMMKIAIVDTHEKVRNRLSGIINEIFPFMPDADKYSSYGNFIEMAMGREKYDLIFVNIVLGKKSGIDLAIEYKGYFENTRIVFYCENMSLAPSIFATTPFGLLKVPFEKKRIKELLEKAIVQKNDEDHNYIGLKNKHGIYCLNLNDICLFESDAREVIVYHNDKVIKVYKKLDDIQNHIESGQFVRCHQSFLINLKHISELSDKKLVMKNGKVVPIARNRLSEVRDNIVMSLGRKCL